jgi:hypothetical protein
VRFLLKIILPLFLVYTLAPLQTFEAEAAALTSRGGKRAFTETQRSIRTATVKYKNYGEEGTTDVKVRFVQQRAAHVTRGGGAAAACAPFPSSSEALLPPRSTLPSLRVLFV